MGPLQKRNENRRERASYCPSGRSTKCVAYLQHEQSTSFQKASETESHPEALGAREEEELCQHG